MFALVYLLNFLLVPSVWCQTRTIWQYQLGKIVPNPYFTTAPSQDHTAQQNAFSLADPIPAENSGWIDCFPGDQYCKSASQINTQPQTSRLPAGDCWKDLAFEYFQTIITLPAGVSVYSFTIQFPGSVEDDAVRVTIFNSKYPAGKTLSFTFYQQASTTDLAPFLATGENRIVLTQEDSCCCGNTVYAIVNLNGSVLNPTCVPPAQQPCTSSHWDSDRKDCVLTPLNGGSCDDCNGCTNMDVCVNGQCQGKPIVCTAPQCWTAKCDADKGKCVSSPDGVGPCNDNDACTVGDTCCDGACVGTRIVCHPMDQCHVPGVCSNGACTNPAAPDGTKCDDGNPCTTNDVCKSGSCGGTPLVCTAKDQCHAPGTCDPMFGVCTNPIRCDGRPCDDGNACTLTDTCKAGTCVGSNPVVCAMPDQCHNGGTCDPKTGKCNNSNKPDGTLCDDKTACTCNDTCKGGVCVGGDPVVCTAPDQCHTAACDPTTGKCTYPKKPDGTHCDDESACTSMDTCTNGVCGCNEPLVCTASDQCHIPGTCDPKTGKCSNPNKADGTPCDDGNACTRTDTCKAGVCTGSNPITCAASDQCHNPGTCDPKTGMCSNPNKPDGTLCDDKTVCTGNDTCKAGVCVGGTPIVCTAPDQCHTAACDPTTGKCTYPKKPDGTHCDDESACTSMDTCMDGVCGCNEPIVCTASDQCHIPGTCDPLTGKCSNPNKADGTPCDDGNACTRTDTCKAGVCTGSNPIACSTVSDQCHVPGTCDPKTGMCSNPNKADGTPCNDGNACTRTDTCMAGVCTGSNPITCSTASDQCHNPGTCDPNTGMCSNPNKADGTPCDDKNACTCKDTCKAGVCVGDDPVVCTAPDQCHSAACDPTTGECSYPKKPDGTHCDDESACTSMDTCMDGVCGCMEPIVCTASDQCHIPGTCDPTTGKCSNPNKADGTPCDDGNACTRTDTCMAGVCTGSNPLPCTASDQCHNPGTCDPKTGMCSNPNKPDGTTCNDNDRCTCNDNCTNGVCGGEQTCCRSTAGHCGTCVIDCAGSHQEVCDLFKLPDSGPGGVAAEVGGGCGDGLVCCVPKDQSTCTNNPCRIRDD